MPIRHLALVSEESRITSSELTIVAAALQKQATRDFAPFWNVQATVSAFSRLEDMPVGYWPIIIMDDIDVDGAEGVHMDSRNQPYALVQYDSGWSLTASHEFLEMLVDPFGNRLIAGTSPMPEQGRVEFLMEVCDPCEAEAYSYTVNGVVVSDFYTPHYFDPTHVQGVRYSYSGKITQPREVLPGGYLSWHNPDDGHWYQAQYFDKTGVQYLPLGGLSAREHRGSSLREIIDSRSLSSRRTFRLSAQRLHATRILESSIAESTKVAAHALRAEINALRRQRR